jgi:small ligand-binding sensory domain FIST
MGLALAGQLGRAPSWSQGCRPIDMPPSGLAVRASAEPHRV